MKTDFDNFTLNTDRHNATGNVATNGYEVIGEKWRWKNNVGN